MKYKKWCKWTESEASAWTFTTKLSVCLPAKIGYEMRGCGKYHLLHFQIRKSALQRSAFAQEGFTPTLAVMISDQWWHEGMNGTQRSFLSLNCQTIVLLRFPTRCGLLFRWDGSAFKHWIRIMHPRAHRHHYHHHQNNHRHRHRSLNECNCQKSARWH